MPSASTLRALTQTPRLRRAAPIKRRVESTRRFPLPVRLRRLSDSPPHAIALTLLAIGAALRIWQYLANSSLWIDELALTRNIIDRPLAALWQPLDYAQVAPFGFLIVEKIATILFGVHEYSLRAFPLLSGLLSLFLFLAVARRMLDSDWAVAFGVGLFALGIPFVYFSSQVKQYSSDVAAGLLLLYAALEVRRRGITARRALWLGLAGAVIAWFSQPAVFVMAGIGTALLILVVLDGDGAAARSLALTGALWSLSAGAVAVHSLATVPELDREYFRWFWGDGFMPFPPQTFSDLLWLPKKLIWVFGAFELGLGRTNGGLNYRWSPVFSVVMVSGYWALWRKQRDAALFLLLPVLVLALLSAASLYPFTARVIAFLIPYLLLATAAGASYLLAHWPLRLQFLTPVALAILGGAPLYAIATALPPSWVQHTRPVLEEISRRREPGDRIYVYYGAGPAFGYYARRVGIPPEGVIFGRCRFVDPRDYLRELDQLRGATHAWVVATHTLRGGELEMIARYLDRIGHRRDTVLVPGTSGQPIEGAVGLLYDLSDQDRLRATSAETYSPVLDPVTGPWQFWGCHGIVNQPRY